MLNVSQSENASFDWRALRAQRIPFSQRARRVQICLAPSERDEFYWCAYGEGRTPSLLLRRFVATYLNGASVPPLFDLVGEHAASPLAGLASFALSRDLHERLVARAKAECVTVSGVLRRFIVAYVREKRSGEAQTRRLKRKPRATVNRAGL